MFKIYITIFAFFFINICSLAGTIDPNVPDEKYVEYGKSFYYVGLLLGKKQDDTSYSGSVVAYKDKIVISAAHLFHKNKTCAVIFDNKLIPIKKIITHKDYNYNKFGSYDIAVCLLSGDLNFKWYPDIYEEKDEKGKICSMSGFGSTGDFLSGIKSSGGNRRAGSNYIDDVNFFVIFCSPSLTQNKTNLEFLISPGDSGGGLFIDNRLAGIHSGVIENKSNAGKSKYGAISVHTRLSTYKKWIEQQTENLLNDTK